LVNKFQAPKAKLYIDYGNGYSEQNSITNYYEVNGKDIKITFDLTNYRGIKKLRFDPIEGEFLNLKINKLAFKTVNGVEALNLSDIKTNGIFHDDYIVF